MSGSDHSLFDFAPMISECVKLAQNYSNLAVELKAVVLVQVEGSTRSTLAGHDSELWETGVESLESEPSLFRTRPWESSYFSGKFDNSDNEVGTLLPFHSLSATFASFQETKP